MNLLSLWLPILVSTIGVFIASSLINTVLPWHRKDFPPVPDEEGVMNALRPFALPPGEYMVPRCLDMKEMKSPAYQAKMERGPVLSLTVRPNGAPSMTGSLMQWAVFVLVASIASGCMAAYATRPDAHSHDVFHFTAFTAFIAYAFALWQMPIWYARPWLSAIKSTVDGAIYAVITGAVFVWLWPMV
jgi:hypothetical protein